MLGIPSQELLCREEAAVSVPFVPLDFFFFCLTCRFWFPSSCFLFINGLNGLYSVDDEGFNMMTAVVVCVSWKGGFG